MPRECQVCGEWACVCAKAKALPAETMWVVRYCATTGCRIRIRALASNPGEPTCKWCQTGKRYLAGKVCRVCHGDYPHEFPHCWFWLDETERARRFRLPYWQERIKAAGIDPKPYREAV